MFIFSIKKKNSVYSVAYFLSYFLCFKAKNKPTETAIELSAQQKRISLPDFRLYGTGTKIEIEINRKGYKAQRETHTRMIT